MLTHPVGIVASTLALGGRPHGVSIAPNGNFCVSQIDSGSIMCGSVTDTTVGMGTEIAVGLSPAHVAIDPTGQTAYTADQGSGTTTIVSLGAGRAIASVPLGDAGFNVTASRSRTWVTTSDGQVITIDAASHREVARVVTGPAANGLALDSLDGRLYVSSRDGGTVSAIDLGTNTVVRTFPVGAGAQRIALSPDAKTLYVASEASGVVVLDVVSGSTTTIPGVMNGTVGLALSPDGERLYTTDPRGGIIQIIDPLARQVLVTLAGFQSPRNVAFTPTGGSALVTDKVGRLLVFR